MLTNPWLKYRTQEPRLLHRMTHIRSLSDEQVLPEDTWLVHGSILNPIVSILTISSPFNPLFKVLFIFRSRYLFAIGLRPIFSFTWNLPRTSVIIPKITDSTKWQRVDPRIFSSHARGCHPLWRLIPKDLCWNLGRWCHFQRLQFGQQRPPDFKSELFPLHSPLLRESRFVSFPLLNNMLKFRR